MNWYKRVYSANERKFTVRELRTRFKAYGIIFTRSASGSGYTLMNKNNGQYTNFHYHKLGETVGPYKLQNMLRDLGVNYDEFIKFKKPRKQSIEQPIEQPAEESTEELVKRLTEEQKNKSWENNQYYKDYYKKYQNA